MRAPDPAARLYWFSAGDILGYHPQFGAEPIPVQTAARLHAFHQAEHQLAVSAGRRAARDFHLGRERELRLALRAHADWRRAAVPTAPDARRPCAGDPPPVPARRD